MREVSNEEAFVINVLKSDIARILGRSVVLPEGSGNQLADRIEQMKGDQDLTSMPGSDRQTFET